MAAMAAMYSWISNQYDLSYFDLPVTPMFPIKTFGLSFQKKKPKIDFQDGGHLGFPIGTILAIFIYKSPQCFLPSIKSVDYSFQEKRKMDFEDRGHCGRLGFLVGTILAIFDLQVILVLSSTIQVNWPCG